MYFFQGRWNNLREVITWTCIPKRNGIEWSLYQDCNKYSLTIEQLEQKAEKRLRTRGYKIAKEYSGKTIDIGHGNRDHETSSKRWRLERFTT